LFDIGNVIRWDENTDNFHYNEPPYSAQKLHERKPLGRNAAYWDCWSIATVILEVIIGTEFVAEIKYYSQMEDLLDQCSQYLDADVMTLLKGMIEVCNIDNIKKTITEILPKRPELFGEAIRGFAQAVEEIGSLKDWIDYFNTSILRRPEHFDIHFGIRRENIVRDRFRSLGSETIKSIGYHQTI